MTTIRYSWHGFIDRGSTFMCLQYSRPLIYHLLPNIWKASYTYSASIFVDVPNWLPYSTDQFISYVAPCPSQWFFHCGEEIVIAWTNNRVSTVDVPESPIASGARGPWQQQCDSLHLHEVWWGSVLPSVVVFYWYMRLYLFAKVKAPLRGSCYNTRD